MRMIIPWIMMVELDGEFSRPQKHVKCPELFGNILDAASVIFEEHVCLPTELFENFLDAATVICEELVCLPTFDKAFREGTTHENAHITFVSLALKLLEERERILLLWKNRFWSLQQTICEELFAVYREDNSS